MCPVKQLPFQNLSARHFGLTDSISGTYQEAARICLDRHHQPSVNFSIEDTNNGTSEGVLVEWLPTDDRTKLAWDNETDATRDGAYGFAIAALEVKRDLIAVSRAKTLTGSDYLLMERKLVPNGKEPEDFEACIRLEASGVNTGSKNKLKTRLNEKKQQLLNGKSHLPGVAVVVGFYHKVILIGE